ncbi:uncharacterized protein LOC101855640 [Aplysia californica]|uniref:Uncharacterized protein LOC101855640 n=1 Tax=Aplysia californica TaxID=6500 RepID=A0ABM0JNF9_APLCA|nr:uncharacterized protein LOC101855640 [Aplysia californica]
MAVSMFNALCALAIMLFLGSQFCWTQEEEPECVCSCIKAAIPEDKAEREEFVENEKKKIVKELHVDKKNLSSETRKKSSAVDERPSARSVGYLGIAMLTLSAGIVLVFDLDYVIKGVHSIGTIIKNKWS